MSTPALRVDDISFTFPNGSPVFSDVAFCLDEGEILTILGPNGSGKSTLLNCVMRLLDIDRGDILLWGRSTRHMSPSELARHIGYVPQSQSLAFDFAVRDYIVMGLAPHIGRFGAPKRSEYEKVDEVLAQLGIERLVDKSIQRMSGGERQLVQLARALVQRPRILLLDEPTNHLDFGNQIRILQVVVNHALAHGVTVMMTTHMPDQATLLGGKAAILDHRGVLEFGDVDAVIDEEALRRIYGVDVHLIEIESLQRTVCVADAIRNDRTTKEPS